ncbi:hypothetical protein, partial [Methanothrix sp.]|uniref:hypothetical protein n=1 Tax=Methanothrix sp. TaxID=90426 RepID=UPI003C71ABA0
CPNKSSGARYSRLEDADCYEHIFLIQTPSPEQPLGSYTKICNLLASSASWTSSERRDML